MAAITGAITEAFRRLRAVAEVRPRTRIVTLTGGLASGYRGLLAAVATDASA